MIAIWWMPSRLHHLLVIDIGVIRRLAIGASISVAVIVFTNLILLPVAISCRHQQAVTAPAKRESRS